MGFDEGVSERGRAVVGLSACVYAHVCTCVLVLRLYLVSSACQCLSTQPSGSSCVCV